MIASEHSKRPMILSIKSVVRARDGSGRPLRERKHISYIFLLRGIRRLRIVLPISRNLRLKFPLKRTKIGRHCKQALYSKSWPAPEMDSKSWPAPEMGTRDGAPEMGLRWGQRWADGRLQRRLHQLRLQQRLLELLRTQRGLVGKL